MNNEDLKQNYDGLKKTMESLKKRLDFPNKLSELEKLHAKTIDSNFDGNQEIVDRANYLKQMVYIVESLENDINANSQVIDDPEFKDICMNDYNNFLHRIEDVRGKYL